MSSSPSLQTWGLSDLWGTENPATTFYSRPTKSRSPFPRRQVFLFVTVIIMITLSVCFLTSWLLPSPRASKPWQLKTNKACERSILGKDIVADEFGYTCQWQDSWMQPSGCCDQNSGTSARFSCSTCDASVGCCGVYEMCVSCCLKEENLQSHFESDRMKQLATKDKEVFATLRDPFELCQMVCRTSSRSLNNVDGNTVFRSESLKYCYDAPTYSTPAIRIESDQSDAQSNQDSNSNNGKNLQNTQQGDQSLKPNPKNRAEKAFKVTADFFRHTTSILSAAASHSSPAFIYYYLTLFVASIIFLRL